MAHRAMGHELDFEKEDRGKGKDFIFKHPHGSLNAPPHWRRAAEVGKNRSRLENRGAGKAGCPMTIARVEID